MAPVLISPILYRARDTLMSLTTSLTPLTYVQAGSAASPASSTSTSSSVSHLARPGSIPTWTTRQLLSQTKSTNLLPNQLQPQHPQQPPNLSVSLPDKPSRPRQLRRPSHKKTRTMTRSCRYKRARSARGGAATQSMTQARAGKESNASTTRGQLSSTRVARVGPVARDECWNSTSS